MTITMVMMICSPASDFIPPSRGKFIGVLWVITCAINIRQLGIHKIEGRLSAPQPFNIASLYMQNSRKSLGLSRKLEIKAYDIES